jgi:hypothetical protein
MKRRILMVLLAGLFALNIATPLMASEPTTLVGTVEQIEDVYVIQTDDADYKIEGMDVSEMVGKEVHITGVVTEDDAGKTIAATAIEEAAAH